MGTNYYLITNYCEYCKRGDKEHLGKSSGGWTFSFQGSPAIKDKATWLRHIQEEIDRGAKIQDEYGQIFIFEDILLIVDTKRNEPHNHAREYPGDAWLDAEGNSFTGLDFS